MNVFEWVKRLVDLINSVRTLLAKVPIEARTAFDNALTELLATYSGIEAALASLSLLSFDSPEHLSATEKILQEVTTGKLERDLAAAKYSCDSLKATYTTHLETYLKAPGVIPKQRRDELIEAFNELGGSDDRLLRQIGSIENEYKVSATQLLALLQAGDTVKMTEGYRPMKQRLLEQRRQLSNEVVEMVRARRALNASLVTPFGPDLRTLTAIAIGLVVLLGVAAAWAWRVGLFPRHGDWYVVKASSGGAPATVAGPFSTGDACRIEIVRASDLGAPVSSLHCVRLAATSPP